jgi:two-component system, OmpR family, sensor kinase
MTRLSLRSRIVAVAAAAIVLAVAGLGITVGVLVGRDLRGSLDQTLRDRAIEISRLSVSTPALLTAPGALTSTTGGTEVDVEVVDRHGNILASSPALGGQKLPGASLVAQALGQGVSAYADGRFAGASIRMFAAPLPEVPGPASGGAVLLGSSLGPIASTLGHVRAVIATSAIAAALLGGLLVAILTGRGLRPLRRLSTAAGEIERSGDASRRLPEGATPREIAELTGTLNAMLAALERSRETERRFLADASHELRTPLTSLRGNAAYLAKHGTDPVVLQEIEADAVRVGQLVDDLLALERAEAHDVPRAAVDLAALTAERAGRAGATLEVCAPALVWGDRVALGGALGNLIDNARLHGPERGEIVVRLEVGAGVARLSVVDEGPGIPPDQIDAAFGRFWRGSEATSTPGSGLGLAIVRATATAHHGRVEVDGSRFTLVIPIAVPGVGEGATPATGGA